MMYVGGEGACQCCTSLHLMLLGHSEHVIANHSLAISYPPPQVLLSVSGKGKV